MDRESRAAVWAAGALAFLAAVALAGAAAGGEGAPPRTVRFGIVGMGGGAFEALKACEAELDVSMVHLTADKFGGKTLPDLAALDAVIASFASAELKDRYRQAVVEARRKNPGLKVFCVGPPQVCEEWTEWLGKGNVTFDPTMARYYGLSRTSMRDMVQYALITHFGRSGKVDPPGSGRLVRIHHPDFGDLESVDEFLGLAAKAGKDIAKSPRVAVAAWRHHCVFHQPKVIKALIDEFGRQGVLAVCLIADDPGFRERLTAFRPNLVVMTSHTAEPAAFWEKLGVPRIHALWLQDESIAQWEQSLTTGMAKGSIQHLIISAEVRGATECLVAGGTQSGGRSGEEILPIPDRIERIVGRSRAWMRLGNLANRDKKIAIVGYDHQADKTSLLCGAQLGLNAPRSLVAFLAKMKEAGYRVENLPADERELLGRLVDHGRQMGSQSAGALDRLARGGKAALVPAERYREWFEAKVPPRERAEMVKYWGEPPGALMVWESEGRRYLVLPKLDLGQAVLLTQPPKGEVLAATAGQTIDADMLPPTHHFMATYFWMQEEFQADALVHFGAHGNEWLFSGKQVALSRHDWSEMLLGNMPNVNPWVSNNTAEVVPCKRRAFAVTVNHLPPILMDAGLSDELLNLESTIDKYIAIEGGALRKKFAASVTEQAWACKLDRELKLARGADGVLADAEIRKISTYLHDLQNEVVPANMHVLGEKPAEKLLVPYYVYCMGKRYLEAAKPLFDLADDALRAKSEEVVRLMLHQKLSPAEAVEAAGGKVDDGKLPAAVRESLEMVAAMDAALDRTGLEIDNVLRALDGKFVPPGPSGSPERNPGVVPTGRNLYVLNPEELPARSSWELGTKLIADYLAAEHKARGRYPRKIAFGLIPFATYSDYGIVESQILYLLGVRPVWDAKNRVADLELIPRAELGRPRIDVFLSAKSVYRDELPDMMRMLDRAVRMVAALDEPDNHVFQGSQLARRALEAKGLPPEKARVLSQARMYGIKAEESVDGHNWYFYLAERSGEWDTRRELLDVYLSRVKNVYTEELWGVHAPESFDLAVQDTELILRSWYDNRDAVLADKFAWWSEGSLSLAIKHLTGKEPGYLFADVRDPDRAAMVDADDAVQRDLRVRLLNPRWVKTLMGEGYNGASQIVKNVDNLMGWEIMRERSVSDENWSDLVDLYVRDSAGLKLPEWFERENPHAFQNVTATMIETARKGFWAADAGRLRELVEAYARSVARHGPSGGLRAGGNENLRRFIEGKLADARMDELLDKYRQALKTEAAPATPAAPADRPEVGAPPVPVPVAVTGQRLDPAASRKALVWLAAAAAVLGLLAYGFLRWKGAMR